MMRLKEIRKGRGLTQQQVADALDLHFTNYNKLENGKTEMTLAMMERLADILKCDPVDLISYRGGVRFVKVTQKIAAGVWSESHTWDEDDWYEVAVPDDAKYRSVNLYGAEASGPSMNKRYPDGSAIVYTSMVETGERPETGKRYLIETERADGMREATVKTLWSDEVGKLWLLPESTDPRYQQPLDLSAGDGEIVRIIGRVVYAVQREN